MGERLTPALIQEALENKRKKAERERVAKKAPAVTQRLTDLVRQVVSDPQLDTDNIYFNTSVDVDFRYPVGDETINLIITSNQYPEAKPNDHVSFGISIEGIINRSIWVSNSGIEEAKGYKLDPWGKAERVTTPFDEEDLAKFEQLLSGIEEGIADESVHTWVREPRPYARKGHFLETLAQEARALSQG